MGLSLHRFCYQKKGHKHNFASVGITPKKAIGMTYQFNFWFIRTNSLVKNSYTYKTPTFLKQDLAYFVLGQMVIHGHKELP